MATETAGISTLGVKFAYGISSDGNVPSTFNWLERCNDIPEYSITPESVDASALEDLIERKVAGRATTGGSWAVVFNDTPDVQKQLNKCISDYKAMTENQKMWFEVYNPNTTKAYFVVAQVPQVLPFGGASQNAIQKITFTLTVEDIKGYLDRVEPTEMQIA